MHYLDEYYIDNADYMNLYNNHNLNYQKIIQILDYTKLDIYMATNIEPKFIRYDDKIPKDLEEHLSEWALAINLVANFFNDKDKTIIWFNTPNPELANIKPKDMIRLGKFKKLLAFITVALDDNSSPEK